MNITGLPGNLPGSYPGSLPGSYPGSLPGSYPGSLEDSYEGSLPGSYPGSLPGSYPGSLPGSYPGSLPGSYPGSLPGSYPGSLPGSYPGSLPGSYPGSLVGELLRQAEEPGPSGPKSPHLGPDWALYGTAICLGGIVLSAALGSGKAVPLLTSLFAIGGISSVLTYAGFFNSDKKELILGLDSSKR